MMTTSTNGACGNDPRIERTRAAVLEAGVAILFEKGPEAVTHAAVATDAHVSRTTVYKHWPTRGELLVEVLDQVEPHKRVEPSGDIRADMQQMGRQMAATFGDQRLNKVFSSLMAQAQQAAQKMQTLQGQLATKQVEGSAGAGMVKVIMTGAQTVVSVEIDPSVLSADRQMLQDLVVAATNNALEKCRELAKSQMGSLLPPGLLPGGIPGL